MDFRFVEEFSTARNAISQHGANLFYKGWSTIDFFRLLDAGIYHNSGYCETHVIDIHLISLRTLSSLIAQIVHMLVQRHTPDPIKLDFHTGNFDKLHRTLHTAQPDCHQIDPSEWEHENKHFSFIYTLHIRRQR